MPFLNYFLSCFNGILLGQILAAFTVYFVSKKGIWALLGYCQEKWRSYSDSSKRLNTNEEDVVYLFQFHRTKLSPNSSPFCLKVESFLRYHKIPYKPIFTDFQRSKQGLLPFIIFNGKEIYDSHIIILELEKHFNLKPQLSSYNSAISQIAVKAIDNGLANEVLYFKVIKNKDQVRNGLNRLMPRFLASLSFKQIYVTAKNRLKSLHILSLPEADIYQGLKLDLEAMNELLCDKKYLFGDEPTAADFGLFAHLCTMYYSAYNQPLKDILDIEYPQLQKYIERILTELFPEFRMYY